MGHRRLVLVLLVVSLLAACAPWHGGRPDADLVRVTLLHVNDLYEIEPVDQGRRGGIARLATLVEAARRENPHTVFVLGGDVLSPSIMSTFLKGEQMVAALNAVGLDVATFGNHEFDFGPSVLRDRMKESRFVWVSANVRERASGQPFGGARRDLLRTLGPVTVGILGLTMPETRATSSPGPDVVFDDPLRTGQAVAADLRRRGAHLVVAITHQDMAADRALAEAADVDVILGGHEHEPLVAEEGTAIVIKAGSDGRYLVQVDLWLTPDGRLAERSWHFREVSRRVADDPDVAAIVKGYVDRMSGELDAVIGRSTVPLEAHESKLRTQETNLGNFVADVMRARTGADVALVNGGGIRTDRTVPPGPLTKRDVHALLPFTNVVMKLEVPGRVLRAALEHGLAQADRLGGGFLQVSGVQVLYDPTGAPGNRIVSVAVGAAPLAEDRAYTVAVPTYIARGGDGFTMLRAARVLVDAQSGPDLPQMIVDAIVTRESVAPAVEGRLRRVAQ